MNLKVGKKIGEGGCSEVFEWENGSKVIKLPKPNTSLESMRRELHNNRMAWENGLSVPQPFELVDIDGRAGVVFERIYGESLMERFVANMLQRVNPEQARGIADDGYSDFRLTAQLLNDIHRKSIADIPSQRETIKNSIKWVDYLSSVEKEHVIAHLDQLPLKQQLCHGDPNPNNILVRDGKAVIIDWTNATIGNPEADLAEYIIMIRYAILPSYLPSEVTDLFNEIRESIITAFIDEYVQLSDITYEDIDAWIVPIAARKLTADGISENEKILLVNEIRSRLQQSS